MQRWGILSASEQQVLGQDVLISVIEAQKAARDAIKPGICGSVTGAACDRLVVGQSGDDICQRQVAQVAANMVVGNTQNANSKSFSHAYHLQIS